MKEKDNNGFQTVEIIEKAKNLVVTTYLSNSLIFFTTLFSKLMNVVLTFLIAQSVTKKAFSLSQIYFSFIYMIITLYPKKILRKTASRYSHDGHDEKEYSKYLQTCQVIWATNIFLTLLSFPLYLLFIIFNSELSYYKLHLIIYIISALIEIYCEPIMIYINVNFSTHCKCFIIFFLENSEIFFNYITSVIFKMDLWSFTLSRFLSSFFYVCFLIFVSKYYYNIPDIALWPNYLRIKTEIILFIKNLFTKNIPFYNNMLIDIKVWIINIFLSFTERVVLGFFTNYSDDIKAEYIFVKKNFSFFVGHSISPREENFFYLLNKIKNYKNITTLKSSKDSSNEYTGDFSFNENQYIKNKTQLAIKNERYSYQLLKNSIRMTFFEGIIIVSILVILGNSFLSKIFSEKWANTRTYEYMFLFGILFCLLSINSKFNSYATALFNPEITNILIGYDYANKFLMVALSFGLTQINIIGLIVAQIIFTFNSIVILFFLTIKNEYMSYNFYSVIFEMSSFTKECLVRNKTMLSIFATYLVCFILYVFSFLDYEGKLKGLIVLVQDIFLILNCVFIFFFEKEDFLDVLRIKQCF